MLVRSIVTVGGLGLSPLSPGSLGALPAIPIAWLLADGGLPLFATVTVALSLFGIVASIYYIRRGSPSNPSDPQEIVIDELAGCLITLAFVPMTPLWVGLGYGLFRLLDIAKPGPIGVLDRRLHGGVGVMVDDIAAGLAAGLLLLGANLLIN